MTDTAEIIARAICTNIYEDGITYGVTVEEVIEICVGKSRPQAEAVISALSKAGWEIRPAEPTEEHVEAVAYALKDSQERVRRIYKAMIAEAEKEPQPCEIKWCKSGLPVAIHVNESMDDGCWRVGLCQLCADAIGIIEGQEMPDARLVKAMIGAGK